MWCTGSTSEFDMNQMRLKVKLSFSPTPISLATRCTPQDPSATGGGPIRHLETQNSVQTREGRI